MNRSNIGVGAGAMVVRSGKGQTFRWGPKGTVRIIAGASTTDRSFSIVESTEPPGSGAPLHVHHGEAECILHSGGRRSVDLRGRNGYRSSRRLRLHAQGRPPQIHSYGRHAGAYADAVFVPGVRKVLRRGRLSARSAPGRSAESRCFPGTG